MREKSRPGTIDCLDRRTVLGFGIATAILADMPAFAQTGKAAPAGKANAIAAPVKPQRAIRLRAEAFRQKLGGPDAPESTMFRLVQIDETGKSVEAAGFPAFRGREGEAFALEIENGLDQPASFHLRGIRGANAEDGMAGLTGSPIPPGGKGAIIVDARQPGTFILAPSLAEHAPEQVSRGLFAAVIVEERSQVAFDRVTFDHDMVLAVSDWRLDEKGALAGDFGARQDAARTGRLGNRLVANGAAAPAGLTVRPGALIRVRMINVSNARMVPLRFDGVAASVYAIDSTPCQPFDPLKRTVTLAPASRIEMVVEAPGEARKTGAIEAKIANGLAILTLRTEGAPYPVRAKAPPFPDPGLPPAIRLQDAIRAEFAITGGIGHDQAEAEPAKLAEKFPDPRRIFAINGAPGGFGAKPVATMRRGRVFVLALHNRTAWPQVIAVHGHAFRLLHAFDDGWEPYFLDTLYMPPNTTARIALIADNPGKWAIRSTIAAHFAGGVSGWFEVT